LDFCAIAKPRALFLFFWGGEGLSLQAKQHSTPPKKPRACLSQAPTKRGVCASLPAASRSALYSLLPVDSRRDPRRTTSHDPRRRRTQHPSCYLLSRVGLS
jgi:hypothetical protein